MCQEFIDLSTTLAMHQANRHAEQLSSYGMESGKFIEAVCHCKMYWNSSTLRNLSGARAMGIKDNQGMTR